MLDITQETKFSRPIRAHLNALDALARAITWIEDIPNKANPELYTAEAKEYIEVKLERLKAFQIQTEAELKDLQEWHLVEISAGRILDSPFAPGGIIDDQKGTLTILDADVIKRQHIDRQQ